MDKNKDNLSLANGVVLLNTCADCGNKFKPIRSMVHETLCALCDNKK